MIAVSFEIEQDSGAAWRRFDLAASPKSRRETTDGFISLERFQSAARPDRFFSLGIWRDEAADRRWCGDAGHRRARQARRAEKFTDYRLRVAPITTDCGLRERGEAAPESLAALG